MQRLLENYIRVRFFLLERSIDMVVSICGLQTRFNYIHLYCGGRSCYWSISPSLDTGVCSYTSREFAQLHHAIVDYMLSDCALMCSKI